MTLVELILSIAILSIVVMAFSVSITFTYRYSQYNRGEYIAQNIASSRLEHIRGMSFASIGSNELDSQDPLYGSLDPQYEVEVDGFSFTVDTFVTWETMSSCLTEGSQADWDVKLVRVVVTGENFFFRTGDKEVVKTVEGMIARDFEQPLLLGNNLRVCVFRGFQHYVPDSPKTPLAWYPVHLSLQNSVDRTVTSNPSGAAVFLQVPSEYAEVTVTDLSMQMVPSPLLHYPVILDPIPLGFSQRFVFLEYPSQLSLSLEEIHGNLGPQVTGEIRVSHSKYADDFVSVFTDHDTEDPLILSGFFPLTALSNESYTFDAQIDDYLIVGEGVFDADEDSLWDGYFQSPQQVKQLLLYVFSLVTDPPDPVDPTVSGIEWLNGASGQMSNTNNDADLYRIASVLEEGQHYLVPIHFQRQHQEQEHGKIVSNYNARYVGSGIHFWGFELIVRNSLVLQSNWIELNELNLSHSSAQLQLLTLPFQAYNDHYYQLYEITKEGQMVLVDRDPSVVAPFVTGQMIPDFLLSGHLSAFRASTYNEAHYGILRLNDQITVSGHTLAPGHYYFPSAFQFKADIGKTPENGGLIVISLD